MSGQIVGEKLYHLNITLIADFPTVQGSQPTKGGRDPIILLAQPLGWVRNEIKIIQNMQS